MDSAHSAWQGDAERKGCQARPPQCCDPLLASLLLKSLLTGCTKTGLSSSHLIPEILFLTIPVKVCLSVGKCPEEDKTAMGGAHLLQRCKLYTEQKLKGVSQPHLPTSAWVNSGQQL